MVIKNSLNMTYFSGHNVSLHTCHASFPSYSNNRNQIFCWRATLKRMRLTFTTGRHRSLVSQMIDLRLAFNPSLPSLNQPFDTLEIHALMPLDLLFAKLSLVLSLLVNTTERKAEEDINAEGERERVKDKG